jgi:glycosyltransferase involved in cell wall biosynthesis
LVAPRVSVILPCYNGARWISQAIESVLAQTFKDFELIIVDDGSTDKSKEIISSYLYDKHVHYIYQENRGFSGALNRGIRESRGEFIGFIGQDDLYMPNKLQVQVKYFDEHKDVDLVHSNYCSIDSSGRIIMVRDVKIPRFPSREKLIKYLFINNFIGFETALVKRECFDEVGLFNERMTGFSDHDIWLRIAGKFNIAYIDLPLVKKREHELQLSKTRIEQVLSDEFLMVRKTINNYPFLKKAERKKLATLYYIWGTTMLQKGRNEEAKQKLLKAIRCRPWKFKAILAYITPTLYRFIWDRYRQSTSKLHRGMRWIEG